MNRSMEGASDDEVSSHLEGEQVKDENKSNKKGDIRFDMEFLIQRILHRPKHKRSEKSSASRCGILIFRLTDSLNLGLFS